MFKWSQSKQWPFTVTLFSHSQSLMSLPLLLLSMWNCVELVWVMSEICLWNLFWKVVLFSFPGLFVSLNITTFLAGRVCDRTTWAKGFSFLLSLLSGPFFKSGCDPLFISCSNLSWTSENVKIVPFLPSLYPTCAPWLLDGLVCPQFVWRSSRLLVPLGNLGAALRPRFVSSLRTKLCWRDIGTIVTWKWRREVALSDILTAHQFGPWGRKTLLLLGRGFGSTAGDCWCGRAWGGEHCWRGRQSGCWRRTNKLSAVLVPVKRLVRSSLLNDNGRIYFLWPWDLRQRSSATMSSIVLFFALFVLFVFLVFARAAHHDWIDISGQRMWKASLWQYEY